MKNKYLVVNAGSSSLKFSLYEMPEEKELINGYVEKIGIEGSTIQIKIDGKKETLNINVQNHEQAVALMLKEMLDYEVISDVSEIKGVGHRIVDGGEYYKESVIIDEEVVNNIEKLTPFVPLHHPGEIVGIKAMQKILPDVPMVAVFDTSFHQSIPKENYIYPIPYKYYEENGVRKYGFHGTSHRFITDTMKEYFVKDDVNLIICHIGSGASVSCIKDGKCIDTSMGLGALDGLMMGTRCGSIDPSLIQYLVNGCNIPIDLLYEELSKESGLKGICGVSDLRDVEEKVKNGDEKAILALNIYIKDVCKYISEYHLELEGNVDALVFTAGAGENSVNLRERVVNKLSKAYGIELNKDANNQVARFLDQSSGIISTEKSKFPIMIVPTNEEIMIARDTYNLTKEKENKVIDSNKIITKTKAFNNK